MTLLKPPLDLSALRSKTDFSKSMTRSCLCSPGCIWVSNFLMVPMSCYLMFPSTVPFRTPTCRPCLGVVYTQTWNIIISNMIFNPPRVFFESTFLLIQKAGSWDDSQPHSFCGLLSRSTATNLVGFQCNEATGQENDRSYVPALAAWASREIFRSTPAKQKRHTTNFCKEHFATVLWYFLV